MRLRLERGRNQQGVRTHAFVFCRPYLSVIVYAGAALAQAAVPRIETHPDSDYFGFDLRVEQDISLDQCKQTCLGETQCKAFTYVEKQRWCFLKTDQGVIKRSSGAIAGRVVAAPSAPDIGAPQALTFLPDYLAAEEDRTRQQIGKPPAGATRGLHGLREQAQTALDNGDLRGAREPEPATSALDEASRGRPRLRPPTLVALQ
jgi:hypothetical protein